MNDSFHITSGQPFTCGRSASSSVADLFNTAVGSPNHSWCGPYTSLPSPVSTVQPAELNFYFAVDVTFTGVSSPVRVYLGQGSQLHVTNNWWIGGPAILNTYPSYSLMSFFFVTTQKIYLVRCPENESGSKTLMVKSTVQRRLRELLSSIAGALRSSTVQQCARRDIESVRRPAVHCE